MENTLELRRKRAALIEQARGILDLAEREKRDLTEAENNEYNGKLAEADKLYATIQREERQAKLEAELAAPINRNQPPLPDPGGHAPDVVYRMSPEYKKAFWAALRSQFHGPEVRALQVGDATEGGYLVPSEFERNLIISLAGVVAVRSMATVLSSGTDRTIPVVTAKPTAAYMSEEGTYATTNLAFGVKAIGAHKVGSAIYVSDELLRDSAFDLPGLINAQFVEAFGELEESKFVNGIGVLEPRGFLLDAQTGVTAASATAIAWDEILDLFHSVKPGYRSVASWLIKDATALLLRKLKDGQGQYIWQPGVVSTAPDTILGRPVRYSDSMPAVATGNKSVAFGDFRSYRIQDRTGIEIRRYDEVAALQGQIVFRVTARNDGLLLRPEAVKVLVQA